MFYLKSTFLGKIHPKAKAFGFLLPFIVIQKGKVVMDHPNFDIKYGSIKEVNGATNKPLK